VQTPHPPSVRSKASTLCTWADKTDSDDEDEQAPNNGSKPSFCHQGQAAIKANQYPPEFPQDVNK
jgi:hypothetical protein